jgi:hypothetical protein
MIKITAGIAYILTVSGARSLEGQLPLVRGAAGQAQAPPGGRGGPGGGGGRGPAFSAKGRDSHTKQDTLPRPIVP